MFLQEVSHRPWPLPDGAWQYYQQWNDVILFHWQVPFEILRKYVPKALTLDSFDGHCYVSLVAFTMQKIRPRGLPPVKFISDFNEVNVRTYVINAGRQGVYFLNIEAQKSLSAFLARNLSGLPFEKALITRTAHRYDSVNHQKNFQLSVQYNIAGEITEKQPLDLWLTERYCLFVRAGESIFRYDIHHKEWDLNSLQVKDLTINYKFGEDLILSGDTLSLSHYSPGVEVVSWRKEKVV